MQTPRTKKSTSTRERTPWIHDVVNISSSRRKKHCIMRLATEIFSRTEDTVVHLDPVRELDLAEGCQNVGKEDPPKRSALGEDASPDERLNFTNAALDGRASFKHARICNNFYVAL